MQNGNRRYEESKRKVVNNRRENEEQENVQKRKKQKKKIINEKKLHIRNVIESFEVDQMCNNTRKMYQTINHLRKDININLTGLGRKKENWQ